MFTTKTRATVIATAAVAALAIPSAASAALPVRSPGTVTPTQVLVGTIAQGKEAGSAGQPGYTNEKCEGLLLVANHLRTEAQQYAAAGNLRQALTTAEQAGQVQGELESHCLVVD